MKQAPLELTRADGAEALVHARRLVHDVAKYLSRVAQNVPEGEPLPSGLLPMLLKDVYALDGARSASVVFAEQSAPLVALLADERLAQIRERLSRADELESSARAGAEAATTELLAICRDVAAILRAIARELQTVVE